MENKDLISIIIPVYKVEMFLEKCVNSVLNQTYKNLEIILVDDGSPDNCPAMCDELAKKDNRIKVIHKENGGLSDARNVGIENATGKYISFIDSDDFINKYFIETLYNNLIKSNSNLSICNFIQIKENDIVNESIKPEQHNINIFEDIDKFKQFFNELNLRIVVAWNKLYKAEIFKNTKIRYPFGKIHEDEFVIHEILNICQKVCYTEVQLYYYIKRNGSIMSQNISEKNIHVYSAFENRVCFF